MTTATPSPTTAQPLPFNEVHRLGHGTRRVRVLAGAAWVTQAGQDLILTAGAEVHLAAGAGPALISPLGRRDAVYQVAAAADEKSQE